MRIFIAILLIVLFMPSFAVAQTTVADVGFVHNGIYLASDDLYVGDTIRIYARMRNYGDVDLTGAVGFYMGDELIQNEQTISLPAGGFDEEVFIDFVVPNSRFNIAARINDTDPQDQDLTNNYTQTALLTPLNDDDKDGVENDVDNCPNDANSDQIDADNDGVGDVCDIDDDNDGLTDNVEGSLGTNSTNPDTDGDGVPDDQDAYPLDVSRHVVEVVVEENETEDGNQVVIPESHSDDNSGESAGEVADLFKGFFNFGEAELVEQGNGDTEETHLGAFFAMKQLGWNTFEFEATNSDIAPVSVEWNFGDGETSDERTVKHVFAGAGTYHVMLQVTDEAGEVAEDDVSIVITFFHLANPVFLALVIMLVILFLLALAAFFRLRHSYEE